MTRQYRSLLVLLALALAPQGCGKRSPAPPPPPEAEREPGPAAPAEPSERDRLLTSVKTKRGDARRTAAEALAVLAAADPTVIDELVELLRDKSTAGPGKTHPTAITSTREAAALALLWSGAKGEEALRRNGFSILREGLSDKDPVVREHTAHTLGKLGEVAKPLGPSLQRICVDDDPTVRAAAFDAVRSVGVADVPALAALLSHEAPDVRRRAAEAVYLLTDVPGDAVPSLTRALDDEDEVVRAAAATGIAVAAPKGATPATARKLADVIRMTYPEEFDPTTVRPDGPEFVYWVALARLGKPAVAPATDLLAHKNMLVRVLAVRTLGELGPDAKMSAEAISKALTDPFANVALEAACTLCRIGAKTAEVDGLIRAALVSPNPGVAAAAVAAVARMGADGKPHVPAALAMLGSPLADARYAAVAFVGTLDPAEGAKQVPALAKLVADEEPLVRLQVGMVLEGLGPAAAPAAEALGKALPAETDDVVRDQFVAALVAMGPAAKPAVAGLLPLVTDSSVATRLRAKVIAAVAGAAPDSAEVAGALSGAAADKDMSVRIAAARAIGRLDPLPADARAALVKLAKSDPRTEVRWAAVRGLAEAGPRAKPARTDLEAIATGTLPGVDLWAKVALHAVDGDVTKAARVVRDGLTDRSPTGRAAAAEALLMIGPAAEDVPALVKILADPGATGRAAAARAVGRVGAAAKPAVPRLTELLTDADGDVRVAAAGALGRVGPPALPAAARLRELVRSDPLAAPAARRALERLGVTDR